MMIRKNEIGHGHPSINFHKLPIHRNHQNKDRLNNSSPKSMQSHQMMKYLHIKVEHDNGLKHSRVKHNSQLSEIGQNSIDPFTNFSCT